MQNLLDHLNSYAEQLCRQTIQQADRLGVVRHDIGRATVLDFSVDRPGMLAGGIRLAEICLAGLADVQLHPARDPQFPFPQISVATDFPLAACIASQYAGWSFSHEKYFAMCSGPARLLRNKEDILSEYELHSKAKTAVGVFESNQLPGRGAIDAFANACHVEATNVTICVARTASLPGALQVVARSLETTLHKLHELKFDLTTIRSGYGTAPLPPIAENDLIELAWTNDCILYGASVHLWVDTDDASIEKILPELPSSSSRDFGEPFLKIFNRNDRDFYKIDKMLFSPAHVIVNNLKTGKIFCCGELHDDILRTSFANDRLVN